MSEVDPDTGFELFECTNCRRTRPTVEAVGDICCQCYVGPYWRKRDKWREIESDTFLEEPGKNDC